MEIKFPNTDKIDSQTLRRVQSFAWGWTTFRTVSVRYLKNLGTKKISLVLLSHAMMSRSRLTKWSSAQRLHFRNLSIISHIIEDPFIRLDLLIIVCESDIKEKKMRWSILYFIYKIFYIEKIFINKIIESLAIQELCLSWPLPWGWGMRPSCWWSWQQEDYVCTWYGHQR